MARRIASAGSGTTTAPKKRAAKTPIKAASKKVGAGVATAKKVAKPALKERAPRKVNAKTGFTVGSDQDIIATELLRGGESRVEIIERLKDLLPQQTRNGTVKPVSNLVSSTVRILRQRGYTETSTFKMKAPAKK